MPKMEPQSEARILVIGAVCVIAMGFGVWSVTTLKDMQAQLPALVFILVVFALLTWALRPRAGTVRVQLAAVGLCSTIAVLVGVDAWTSHFLVHGLNHILAQYFPAVPQIPEPSGIPWPLLLFGFGNLFFVFYFTRGDVLPLPAPLDPQSPLRGPEFSERLKWAVQNLEAHLSALNKKLDWSEGRFVELEAELEESSDTGSRRRVPRLVDALRKTRHREIVLLLGEPGTGKSVAMRRLASQLLQAGQRTEVLTVYVNLREWPCPSGWTPANPPIPEEVKDSLWQWIKEQMHQRIDGAGLSFTAQYSEDLLKSGRLFFLLDSFDETRALLDLPKENILVERITEGVRSLLCGDNKARGIIASRYDRSPARWLNADRWYELRPLENKRIEQLVRQHFNDEAVWRWLREQPEIAMLPRNPFEVFLIAEHLELESRDDDNRPVFPKSRAEAYASCLRRRLKRVRELLEHQGDSPGFPLPSIESLEQTLLDLADAMYTGPRGLEVAVRDLSGDLGERLPERIVEAFVEARVLRAGEGEDRTVSFIHSRFGEALAARLLVEHPEWVSFEDIPTVGRWRDVLIVYFEIASLEQILPLAEECYREIEKLGAADVPATHPHWMRAVRCLRFLDEACRYRREASESISTAIADKLGQALATQVDPLTAKLLIEGLSLAHPKRMSVLLAQALQHDHPVVRETALWACRYLTEAEGSFFKQFRKLLLATPPILLLHPRWTVIKRLKSIPSLRPLGRLYMTQVGDMLLWLAGVGLTSSVSLDLFLIGLFLWLEDSTYAVRKYLPSSFRIKFCMLLCGIRGFMAILFCSAGVLVLGGGERLIRGSIALLIGITSLPILPWMMKIASMSLSLWNPLRGEFWKKLYCGAIAYIKGAVLNLWKFVKGGSVIAAGIIAGTILLIGIEAVFPSIKVEYGGIAFLCFFCVSVVWQGSILACKYCMITCRSLYSAFTTCRSWWNDYKTSRDIILPKGPPDRPWIQRVWQRLATTYWRNKLVDRLQSVQQITGEWSGQPPYTGTDKASRRLMKLDERWLGLER